MSPVRIEFDPVHVSDYLKPMWRWRVVIGGTVVAEGEEVFFPRAREAADRALFRAV